VARIAFRAAVSTDRAHAASGKLAALRAAIRYDDPRLPVAVEEQVDGFAAFWMAAMSSCISPMFRNSSSNYAR
jgi:hypothetical protein